MRKEFIGTCVENPFKDIDELNLIIYNAKEITANEFINNCNISDEVLEEMGRHPYDFTFYNYFSTYFYVHSAVEYFYQ